MYTIKKINKKKVFNNSFCLIILVENINNKMSVTSVQSMNNQNLMNINDKMLDNIDLVSDIEQAVTLEELKEVFKYCFRYVVQVQLVYKYIF